MIEDIRDIMAAGPYVSMKDMLERVAAYFKDTPALQEIRDGQVVTYTFSQIFSDVEALGEALIEMGLEGKHIAISADNSYRFVVSYLSICGGVGVAVPVDKDAPEQNFSLLLAKCDAEALICSAHMLKKAEYAKETCPLLKTVIVIEGEAEGYPSCDKLIERGRKLAEKGYYHNKKLDMDATAAIFFTSGTTGANKGVMRSQINLNANIMNCIEHMKGDSPLVSLLPMNHAAINNDIVSRLAVGKLTCINGSIKDLMANLQIFKPKMLSAVPMFAEMIYRGVWQGAEKQGKAEALKQAVQMSNGLLAKGVDKRSEIFHDVLAPFGGIESIGLGGAPISPELVQGMHDIGVDLITGYGVTECGPLISMNSDTINDPFSTGQIVPHTEVMIDEPDEEGIGEILARGPSIMKGYYKDEEATKAVLSEDGWFRTGDYGKLDGGKLFLKGRKKNLILLSNGKNVTPEEIEYLISITIPYIRESVVYAADTNVRGNMTTFITAAIYTDMPDGGDLKDKLMKDFKLVNDQLPQYKKVRCLQISNAEFEKNAMRKIVRDSVVSRHDTENGILI